MLRRAVPLALAACCAAVFSPAAWAGESGGLVSAAGEAAVRVVPRALRVEVQVHCTGPTFDAAMKQLKERREAALKKVKELKADAASVRAYAPAVTKVLAPHHPWIVGVPDRSPTGELIPLVVSSTPTTPPSLSTVPSAGAAPRDLTQSLPPDVPGPLLYSVSAWITAEWPLEGRSVEAVVPEVEKLQARILAADLPGEKSVAKSEPKAGETKTKPQPAVLPPRAVLPTPMPADDPDAARSYPAPVMSPGASTSASVPTTRCLYVAKPSEQQRKAMMAEAFAKAKARADDLAQAAGGKLGSLSMLSHSVLLSVVTPVSHSAGGYFLYAAPPSAARDDASDEVVLSEPNEAEFRIQVQAQFHIE